jgi:hypothetical protein
VNWFTAGFARNAILNKLVSITEGFHSSAP